MTVASNTGVGDFVFPTMLGQVSIFLSLSQSVTSKLAAFTSRYLSPITSGIQRHRSRLTANVARF